MVLSQLNSRVGFINPGLTSSLLVDHHVSIVFTEDPSHLQREAIMHQLSFGWWFGTFFHILGKIIPTDELIFFRGVGIPPTSHDIPLFFVRSACSNGFLSPSLSFGATLQAAWKPMSSMVGQYFHMIM